MFLKRSKVRQKVVAEAQGWNCVQIKVVSKTNLLKDAHNQIRCTNKKIFKKKQMKK